MEQEKKKVKAKARLIALGVSLLLLAAAMGITLWQYREITAAALPFDLTRMIVINCVGALALYLIISHFLKKSFLSEHD